MPEVHQTVVKKSNEFRPFSLVLNFETVEDLKMFYQRTKLHYSYVREHHPDPTIDVPSIDLFMEPLIRELIPHLRQAGLETEHAEALLEELRR